MKKISFLLMLLVLQLGLGQTNSIVENYPLKAMDLVLYSFGMDNPIAIGTVSDSGELDFKFPKDLNFISDEAKANFLSDAAFTLFSKCDSSYDILSEEENSRAINVGYISLSTKENPYAGLLFMVTDENMVPWLESYGDKNAILGSYFELVYIESDFSFQGECTSTISNTEDDTIVTNYSYYLQLKAGFNFIEYQIESTMEHEVPSMYEENVFEKINKPSTIIVTSSQATPPNTKWIGKYF
ncbi:hypothetical protein [Maribacter hydrothermalis]|uniref:Uncharacterized protein n=1 Tax=Maribacter hydrothermalis TaxID=1836467 RepID=A0A1B7ZET3_9FLAO|nr:hypothetical protein [Maribacter hydrothermalis]APQ17569.1 hypothetical protein BTR34_09615 [Maribacter hydrothermalis]OBR42044.1 hypothetical protein A9200_01245 [Maribacter hydrothermalis]